MAGKAIRVLMIEDNPADARLIEHMLREAEARGFETETASTLAAGLARLAGGGVDLILLDFTLPDSRGIETFERVLEAARSLPIVVVTGLDDLTIALRAVKNGAQDYLVKGRLEADLLARSIHYAIERKRLELALQASRASFRNVVEKSPDGVLITDPGGRIHYVNPSTEIYLGSLAGDLVGNAFDGLPEPGSRREVPLTRPDGSAGVGEMRAVETEWEGEAALLLMARDVTERIQAEREIKRVNEELVAANEDLRTLDQMKTHFLSTVSHELRTPLVSVRGYSEMIATGKSGPVNKKQKSQLRIALKSIDHLLALIDNLVDFSRLELGSASLSFGEFDLGALVRDCVNVVRPKAQERHITITVSAEEPRTLLQADERKIGQVVLNLLDNALKFNREEGKVALRVRRVETEGGAVAVVEVSDTGIGIPPRSLRKIFDRFYQVDHAPTRKYVGVGIGLSICESIVRLHAGEISVDSVEGEGSTFTVRLPLRARPQPAERISI